MGVQMASFLLISYLTIISSERNSVQEIIDIYSTNLTLEWNKLNISICRNPTITNVPLLKVCSKQQIFSIEKPKCLAFKPSQYECPGISFIGVYCNISKDACEMAQPCINNGACYGNDKDPSDYTCQCSPGYSGKNCEYDNSICKNNTCWHAGECIVMNKTLSSLENKTTFDCDCVDGYDGTHCELVTNMCTNIRCLNNGLCMPSYLSWSCRCLDSTYGKYCENKLASLIIKQALSKSFASIAITAITVVFIFVITMDILKYVFNIDPVDRERKLMKLEQQKRQFNKKKEKKKTKIALRSFYIS